MPSPGYCCRCGLALPADSTGELCPACLSSLDAAASPDDPIGPAFEPGEPNAPGSVTGPYAPLTSGAVAAETPFATALGPRPDSALPPAPSGYDLLRWLGCGGMGDVYLAREQVSERVVAMKFLRVPGSPEAVERFLAEVRALARIDHPNIVRFVGTDFARAQPYFTMEYAPGGNLAERVAAEGPFPPAKAARLVAAAARAVHAAHAVRVLHRDIKPSNILVAEDGSPKVSDFGLAKLTDREGITTADRPLGTPGYMPPEQVAHGHGAAGPAADVYGLGATLYYLLTGRAPFVGATPAEIVARVERDPPDRPRALRSDVPAELEAVCLKCLEKNPAARYESAAALAADLDDFLAGRPTLARPLTPLRRARRWLSRKRNRVLAAVGAIALGVALVAVGAQLRKDPPPPRTAEEVMRDELAAGQTVRLLAPDGRPRSASWPLGPAELHASADDGGTFAFDAVETCVLLLTTDPGIDSYRIEAEICQQKKLAGVQKGVVADNCDVGLVFAYAAQDGAGGTRVHSMMVLGFIEPERGDPAGARREVGLKDIAGVTGGPGFAPRSFSEWRGVPPLPLKLSESGEPAVRKVAAEVTPAGVRVATRSGPHLSNPAAIADRRERLAKNAVVAPLPDWSPRMPVGIWCRSSTVSVRNVTLTPLP